ncbi:flagellar rod assembly protein/muramidase FlgJ [Gammaproteobacteria bacterium 45_16_T64]|nr:flagellar rod assembly protein/muramidase FlgJ [Gammaproteobacteria bacterium 45_16_T64]
MSDKPILSAPSVGSSYHDMSDFQRLRTGARNHDDKALVAVAKQLEGVFLNMMLKGMRDANKVFSEGNPLNTKETEFYQGMFDQQISLTMAEGKGIGLADVIVRQMRGREPDPEELQALMEKNKAGLNDPIAGFAMTQEATPYSLLTETHGIDLPVPKTDYALPMERLRSVIAAAVPQDNKTNVAPASMATGIVSTIDATAEVESDITVNAQSGNSLATNVEKSLRNLFPNAAAFIDAISPYAKAAANELGVEVNGIIAQAALETGWGKHVIHDENGKLSFNLFGIKSGSHWSGDSAKVKTLEFRGGIAEKETASFRSYNSMDAAFQDYVSFLKSNPRYQDALNSKGGAEDWGFALQEAGYATDPNYGKKIAGIVSRLDRSDKN